MLQKSNELSFKNFVQSLVAFLHHLVVTQYYSQKSILMNLHIYCRSSSFWSPIYSYRFAHFFLWSSKISIHLLSSSLFPKIHLPFCYKRGPIELSTGTKIHKRNFREIPCEFHSFVYQCPIELLNIYLHSNEIFVIV